jgi:predicted alpha-1,2-mannosidase
MHEVTAAGETVHYSPSTDKVEKGYLYSGTGFWDTFRALFPLVNLLYPDEATKMQSGWLNFYRESGFYPEWSSPGHRGCMVGNNSASVITDGILKGLSEAGTEEALYEGMLYGANHVHPRVSSSGRAGYEYYNKLGYVPYNVGINENAARTLEYAYDDWCIYQAAKKLGRPQEEINLYRQRSKNYANLFDPETKLMRGKNEDGTFCNPFNPLKWGDAFTEGNSWHYTWSVFHDIQGLINLMGGKKEFVAKLDTVFTLPPIYDDSYYGGVIHEIREMEIANMGNYAHGNQPIQHMIYLYGYAGEPWKTQYWARQTMKRLYMATPDGYCGDEDNGQTSAWYVFSALGFYPVCPASGQYVLGAPLFDKATISLQNGKKIEIVSENNSDTNLYMKSMRLNGSNYTKNYLEYNTLIKGAKINCVMDSKPNTSRGIGASDVPYSLSNE